MKKLLFVATGIIALGSIVGYILAERDFQNKRKEIDAEAYRIKEEIDRDMVIRRQMDDISNMIADSLRRMQAEDCKHE